MSKLLLLFSGLSIICLGQSPIGSQFVQGMAASGSTQVGNPVKVGCVYNSSGPAPANGNAVDLQCDSAGLLKVNVVAGGGGSGGTSSNFNSAFPTAGTAAGASDGTDMKPLLVDGSGFLKTIISGALPAGTNVIGHAIIDSGSTTAVTGNVTVIQGTGTNLHSVLDSGSTTAVTQATGTNLHMVVDSGTITAVTAISNALPAGTNVIGHVIADTGSTTAVTGNVTVVQGTGTNLHIVCDSGCTPGGSFSDNSAFTAGSTAINVTGGWYSTSPTNCTTGNACAPQLTLDRKLFVQDFQGTSPWVVSANGGTFAVTQSGTWNVGTVTTLPAVTQGTSPWVDSVTTWAGGTLGAMANYGTSPGAVLVPGVNAFITNTPAVSQSGTWNIGTVTTLTGITNALPAGTNVIGHVIADSGSTTAVTGNVTVVQATGTNLHSVLDSGSTTAVTQATAASLNATVVGTGTFAVQAAQSGTWNIGTVTTLTGITNALPAGTNVIGHVIADSGSTTAVTGNVTVVQGTGTNLHAVTDSGSVTAATLSAETTKVIGTVRVLGNGGATVDSTVGAGTAPTNAVAVGGLYNTSAPGPTGGQAVALQVDQAGNLRHFPGIATAALSAWNSSTALNATQNIYTNSGAEAVEVLLAQTTTLTGGAISFDVSFDGTNWVTIPANVVLDPTSTSYATISLPYTVQANTNKAFLIPSNGWQGLRIKLTTQISGTGTVTPTYTLLPYAAGNPVIAFSPTAANFNATIGAALPAGTNVIGHVIADSGSTTAVTGNVTVIQGTGTNLHTVTDSGSVTNATLSAETTKVIGEVNQGTSPWIVAGGGTAGSAASGVVTVQGIASMTKLLVTPDSVALPANQSVNVSQINGVTPLMGNGTTGTGSLRVTIASDTTANSNPYLVQIVPGTSGGLSAFNLQPAASDNHTVIKNGAGQVYHITATNNSATINYLRLYDAGTGFNGCNSATNLKHEIVIPGNSTNAAGFVEDIAQGIAFANGISICVTSGYGNTDTTNATATAMMVDVDYK